MSAPESTEVQALQRFLRGEIRWQELAANGVMIALGRDGVEAQSEGVLYSASPRDLSEGLLRLELKYQDLREWAQIVLGASTVFELSDDFETDTRAERVLSAVWDIAFGERPSDASMAAARELAPDCIVDRS